MARRPGELRREEILRATVDRIADLGLAHVRVSDVATSMGVSTALLFYHFDTKERLVAEAFTYAAERDLASLDRTLAGPGPALTRLGKVLDFYAPTGRTTSWTLWIEAWAAALTEPEIRDVWLRLDGRWKDVLSSLIDEAVAAGDAVCADSRAATMRIAALMDGLAVQVVVHPKSITRAQLKSWVRSALAAELGVEPVAIG